ncbi:hypothetical protein AB0N17_09795 [Streptomyces sp. NPDC051133]|uniref:hypothetical protein n=1 Tax=Streptomyces sp. NPDC051133 TaxID=3155521 RepID=UPI0034163A96
MFRGTTARARLALLAGLLLAFQLFAPTGPFASAHTLSQAQAQARAEAEPGIASPAEPVRDGVGSLRAPGCTGDPAGVPHLRDRQRRPSSGCAQEHPLIADGPAAGAEAPHAPGAEPRHAARPSRAPAPAVLQVFRC